MQALTVTARTRYGYGVRLFAFAAAWLVALVTAGGVLFRTGITLFDARVYWLAWHGPLYANGFVYPPPGALLFLPAAFLPWPVFAVLWLAALAAAGTWLLWPLPLYLRVPLLVALAANIAFGNAAILLAAVLVWSTRLPALWSVLGATKVTPLVAAVALVRTRQWRALSIAVGATALVGLAIVVIVPGLATAWLSQLQSHSNVPVFLPGLLPFDLPLAARLPLAALVAWLGASRRWTLAIAAAIAAPDLSLATSGLLAAVPRLVNMAGAPEE